MLLFFASCVDRSLLVDTVRDYSAYDFCQLTFSDSSLVRRKQTYVSAV